MKNTRSLLDRPGSMRSLDTLRMSELLRRFSSQVEDARKIGRAFRVPSSLRRPYEKILFVGMGGSAIGGDVIRSLLSVKMKIPIGVSRHYELPAFADQKTLCIFSSYSGNTEETLWAFRQALGKHLKSLVITSGGELARLSQRHAIPWIKIPSGLPPRAALGYSVFPILNLFSGLKLWKQDLRAFGETVALLKSLGKKYSPEVPLLKNPAKQLAEKLWGRWVAIYAGTDLLDSAALRFRGQIEENAKAMASHHILPEMNHNEILGWCFPKAVLAKCACVFLEDSSDHPRIRLRIRITKDLIKKQKVPVQKISSQGKSRLARLFSVIHLGDWVSYYLALLNGIDPTPVKIIEFLKHELAKTPLRP